MEPYVNTPCRFITVSFEEDVDGKRKQKGTFAKMARGEMVRFLAENGIEDIEGIKKFTGSGYRFREELSGEWNYVFVKEK